MSIPAAVYDAAIGQAREFRRRAEEIDTWLTAQNEALDTSEIVVPVHHQSPPARRGRPSVKKAAAPVKKAKGKVVWTEAMREAARKRGKARWAKSRREAKATTSGESVDA
jgi:hypothetical protein